MRSAYVIVFFCSQVPKDRVNLNGPSCILIPTYIAILIPRNFLFCVSFLDLKYKSYISVFYCTNNKVRLKITGKSFCNLPIMTVLGRINSYLLRITRSLYEIFCFHKDLSTVIHILDMSKYFFPHE
uniref:Uncharacterized protein n=1 Tax=Cacopsylla melanoneura TaxID=428564 RepID=A0A8D8RTE8_9HEMI